MGKFNGDTAHNYTAYVCGDVFRKFRTGKIPKMITNENFLFCFLCDGKFALWIFVYQTNYFLPGRWRHRYHFQITHLVGLFTSF